MTSAHAHHSQCRCEDCLPWRRESAPEHETVLAWRLHELLKAGYSVHLAEQVAASPADLHDACKYVAQGCAPAVAALIVL